MLCSLYVSSTYSLSAVLCIPKRRLKNTFKWMAFQKTVFCLLQDTLCQSGLCHCNKTPEAISFYRGRLILVHSYGSSTLERAEHE